MQTLKPGHGMLLLFMFCCPMPQEHGQHHIMAGKATPSVKIEFYGLNGMPTRGNKQKCDLC